MPPIPIHTSSPINAKKASGTTPQTAQPADDQPPPPSLSLQPQQASASNNSRYPAAQPGERASLPAPTGALSPPTAIQPTPTTKDVDAGPPAPQPGAVPTAPNHHHLAPPPKAGEAQQTAQPQPEQMPVPPQMSYALYGGSERAPGYYTTTSQVPMGPGPTLLHERGAGNDISHPPGYHQNIHATDFSVSQRAAHEASVAESSRRMSLPGINSEEDGVWGQAKKWATSAGESLAAAEHEVWRRINKD